MMTLKYCHEITFDDFAVGISLVSTPKIYCPKFLYYYVYVYLLQTLYVRRIFCLHVFACVSVSVCLYVCVYLCECVCV